MPLKRMMMKPWAMPTGSAMPTLILPSSATHDWTLIMTL